MTLLLVVLLSSATATVRSQSVLDEVLGELEKDIRATLDDRSTIAFIPLEDVAPLARENEIGVTVTEYLSAKLLESGELTMVERGLLNHVLDELELSRSGLIDTHSAVETGKLVSADTILCGTVTAVSTYFDVNIRAIDTKTGRVMKTFVAEVEQDVFVSGSPAPGRTLERVQIGLDALERAIVEYHQLSYDRIRNEFHYPKSLDELVPKHIDRIPDPIKGDWVYNPETGAICHSVYGELKPTAPRHNPKPIMDRARRAVLQANMRNIYVAIQMYYAELGEPPDQLQDLKMYLPTGELPEALDGEWTWDSESGVLGHSTQRDLTMKIPSRKW